MTRTNLKSNETNCKLNTLLFFIKLKYETIFFKLKYEIIYD